MTAAIIPFPTRRQFLAPPELPKKVDLQVVRANLAAQKLELTRLYVNMNWAIQQALDALEDRP